MSVKLPPFSPGLLLVAALALVLLAFLLDLVHVSTGEGKVNVNLFHRTTITFDFEGSWLLLGLTITLGWAVATAIQRSEWVPGSDRLFTAMLVGTLLGWLLARSSISRVGYLLLSVAAALVTLLLLSPLTFPPRISAGVGALAHWAFNTLAAPHYLFFAGLVLLMGISGSWTSWWVFRRHNGLVAMLPTGTSLAVEILNDSSPALYFFTLLWLASAVFILLRLNFLGLQRHWRERRIPRAADTAWSFGEIGFEATALLLVISFALPPLSTQDLSTLLVPGSFRAPDVHPFGIGITNLRQGPLLVGYSETVQPGSPLQARSQTVMVITGESPLYYPYWRGIALGGWDGIRWYQLPSTPDYPFQDLKVPPSQTSLPRADLPADPSRLQFFHDDVRMVVPFQETSGTVFSGGELIWVDKHPIVLRGMAATNPSGSGQVPFNTVDRVTLGDSPKVPYDYLIYQAIPDVDVQTLQRAGTDYPSWLQPYRTLYFNEATSPGYSTDADAQTAALAQQIVRDAKATNPYDEAKAIETWLRDKSRFTYTLVPPQAPRGVRPIDYFLFNSHRGYCQDFSTAMAIMLRDLGIPVRQMSGFGQGVFDDKTRRFIVNATDAHSWVEVWFPGYGWIPFEPTPDVLYPPIDRPLTPAGLNLPGSDNPTPARTGSSDVTGTSGNGDNGSQNLIVQLAGRALFVVLAILLLMLLALGLGLRWLMSARDLPRIWRRLLFLADRLGVPRRPGDTPRELGKKLGSTLPDLSGEVDSLANLYTRARFRRGGLTPAEEGEAFRSWRKVRKHYPGLLLGSLRHPGARGAAAPSRSRSPARPR